MKIAVISLFLCLSPRLATPQNEVSLEYFAGEIRSGMTAEEFAKVYPKQNTRTYRVLGDEEWLTFDYKANYELDETVTFHLKGGRLEGWTLNDRGEVVREYLSEFAPVNWPQAMPNVYQAIKNVLEKLPDEVFLKLTDRKKPVVFTEYHSVGVGRFANTSAITSLPDDPPSFTDGITIVKLNSDLNAGSHVGAVEGVIAHEMAHIFLGHLSGVEYSKDLERKANHLVKEWGFTKEYEKAKERFGQEVSHGLPEE